ncbi:hypothetical protein M378DRAFT_90593 [Amanita muscaria Koide BX008]|uniref:Uncharacterized protein n=1 Tax=Amanita muscaria (strain Koide BX008) TaxID=946122 RepID=A0A0C2WGA7_AMAMK|nr:hypothetical protein M378DRAFT_90593 [Amanita muscaria Koide BX008]
MTRQRWTSTEQRDWLEALIPEFLEAQEKQATGPFYAKVYEDWAKTFPHPLPTAEGSQDEQGKAKCTAQKERKATELRVFHWFHNNTRAHSIGSTSAVIPVEKPTKLLGTIQAYQKLYYEKKLKPLIDTAYKENVAKAKGTNEKPRARLVIQNEIVRAEFSKESDEVKAEIEQYRQSLRAELPVDDQQTLEKYQKWVRNWLTLSARVLTFDNFIQRN